MKFLIFLFIPILGFAQNKPLKYKWTKISGPEQYRLVSPDSAVTSVTDLEAGVYQFELKVTNSQGLSARDTMVLTVRAPEGLFADKLKKAKLTSSYVLGRRQ